MADVKYKQRTSDINKGGLINVLTKACHPARSRRTSNTRSLCSVSGNSHRCLIGSQSLTLQLALRHSVSQQQLAQRFFQFLAPPSILHMRQSSNGRVEHAIKLAVGQNLAVDF